MNNVIGLLQSFWANRHQNPCWKILFMLRVGWPIIWVLVAIDTIWDTFWEGNMKNQISTWYLFFKYHFQNVYVCKSIESVYMVADIIFVYTTVAYTSYIPLSSPMLAVAADHVPTNALFCGGAEVSNNHWPMMANQRLYQFQRFIYTSRYGSGHTLKPSFVFFSY